MIADIAREVIAVNRAAERVNVYEIMSKPVVSLPADMSIKYAVRLLVRFDLSNALVVDAERKPFGIVTLRDMVLCYGADCRMSRIPLSSHRPAPLPGHPWHYAGVAGQGCGSVPVP